MSRQKKKATERKVMLCVTVDPVIKAGIERVASEEGSPSMSFTANRALKEWLAGWVAKG